MEGGRERGEREVRVALSLALDIMFLQATPWSMVVPCRLSGGHGANKYLVHHPRALDRS